MTFLKTGALAAALLGAAGAGAAFGPTAYGQSVRIVDTPRVQVFTGGSRIGVTVADLDAADAKGTGGVRVESVEAESPAATAGLQTGDVIVEFDGERVRSVRQFSRLVSETPAGRQVTAAVMRDGKRTSLSITPRDASAFHFDGDMWRAVDEVREMARIAPHPTPRPPSPPRPPRAFGYEPFALLWGNQLGVTVDSLSDQLKEYFGVKDGVLVTSVTENSAASKAGLRAGDVITSLNGSRIDSPSELREEIREVDPGQEFTLEITRDRKPMTLKGKAEEPRSRRSTTRVIL
jgi:serine protease Do